MKTVEEKDKNNLHTMINKDCVYFPCHDIIEDCTFCYCPFYPCNNIKRGKWIQDKSEKIWDCSECNWIHLKDTVNKFGYSKENKNEFNEIIKTSENN